MRPQPLVFISYGPSALPEPEETPVFCYPYCSPSPPPIPTPPAPAASIPSLPFPLRLCPSLPAPTLPAQPKPAWRVHARPSTSDPFMIQAWHQIPECFSHPTGMPPCIEEGARGGSQLPKHPSPGHGTQPWAGCFSLPAQTPTPTVEHLDKPTAHP